MQPRVKPRVMVVDLTKADQVEQANAWLKETFVNLRGSKNDFPIKIEGHILTIEYDNEDRSEEYLYWQFTSVRLSDATEVATLNLWLDRQIPYKVLTPAFRGPDHIVYVYYFEIQDGI